MARRMILIGVFAVLVAACSSGAKPTLVVLDGVDGGDSAPVVAGTETMQPTGDSIASLGPEDLPSQDLDAVTSGNTEAVTGDDENSPTESNPTPLVIYDTDIGPDVDDVLALAMLHGYQNEGRVEIAAVTISRNSPKGAQYTDAINTFYGRPDIPIGIYRGGTDQPYNEQGSFLDRAGSWDSDVANQPLADGYRTIRKILADNAGTGRRILIVQTGFSGTTSALINTGGDDISSKTSVELLEENNTSLVNAAGSLMSGRAEFNIKNDIKSAQNLFSNWPEQMVLSPFEVGEQILYPYSSIQNDFNWVDRHPVREAYEHRDLSWHQDAPAYYNMRSWDLTAVMQAVEPSEAYFFLSESNVALSINNDGTMNYQSGQGMHQLLDRVGEYSASQRQRIVNRMIQLTSAQR